MFEIPDRRQIAALLDAAGRIAPTTAVGFSRQVERGRVAILYAYAHGLGGFEMDADDAPVGLLPSGDEIRHIDLEALVATRHRATEAYLLDNQTGRVVSVRLPGVEPAVRCWMAFVDPRPLSPSQLRDVEQACVLTTEAVLATPDRDARLRQLERLEQAAGLIPALLHVLDVRDVIDRLSATAQQALPHDLLLLNLFSDDLSTFTVYARSDKGAGLGEVRPNVYPPVTIEAWTFSLIDDHRQHPLERLSPATRIGARASMRFPVRFDGRVIGGVTFVSFTPKAYSDADIPIGYRLSEHVASAVSHFRLAEQLAREAKRAEALRAQTANLELLDELLSALTDVDGVAGAFTRISTIAGKVLVHDALALPVFLGEGTKARRYASSGLPEGPEVIDVPEYFLDPDWEYDLVADASAETGAHNARVVSMGYYSVLRVPIRIEGRPAGTLIALARDVGRFRTDDILVARRIADRLAVTLARDRELSAVRRADEAAERAARLEARVQALTEELDSRTGYRHVIGESVPWRRVLTQATQVAATDTTVLLLGESGTGKEVIARFLHRASRRSRGPFLALNCAALPEQLLEAELFGYERGAFTGATQSKPGQLEQASGGTLFLDEVGEMSLAAQAKLLRVLQEREFQRLGGTRVLRTDARIVAATNRDLLKAIGTNQFREDLYYRLNVFAIRLPPLRERRDDILPLTQAFLKEFGTAFAHPPAGISREARQRLLSYHWPGNIRELRNLLERAAILCDGGLITDAHLALTVESPAPPPASPTASAPTQVPAVPTSAAPVDPNGRDLQSVERRMIEEALGRARFNKSKAAKELGLTRHQLYIRMKRHGMSE